MLDSIKGMIFAKKPYAYEVVEKLAEMFATIDNVTSDIRGDLFYAVSGMIKYHFKDDDKKRVLITMMLKNMSYDEYKNLSRNERLEFQKEKLQNGIALRDNIINQKDNVIDKKEKENSKLRKLLRENNISF